MPDWRVPFDKDGNLVRYEHDSRIVHTCPNFEFQSTLEYKTFHRGRSAACFEWTVEDGGLDYGAALWMGMKHMDQLIKLGAMDRTYARGVWTFVKQGQNFGIRLVRAT
jgi:hypothetical protein